MKIVGNSFFMWTETIFIFKQNRKHVARKKFISELYLKLEFSILSSCLILETIMQHHE